MLARLAREIPPLQSKYPDIGVFWLEGNAFGVRMGQKSCLTLPWNFGIVWGFVSVPTLLRWCGFRFFFYSNEAGEPPHVHVENSEGQVKIWLETLEVARSKGMDSRTVATLLEKVEQHQGQFVEAWHEYFKA